MGREIRRVPLDFSYPLNRVWTGFYIANSVNMCFPDEDSGSCERCRKTAELLGVPMESYGCPDFGTYLAEPLEKLKELLSPPTGEGYQLWETTSEGSPISPVFRNEEDLREWRRRKGE